MTKWRNCKLGDLLEIKHGFAFLGEYFADAGTHIVLTPGNFFDGGGFKHKGEKEKWYCGQIPADYVLNKGDVLIAMTEQAEGLLGSSAIIPSGDLYLHNQRLGLIYPRDEKVFDKHFAYYLFNSKLVRQQIRGSASGTKIRHTSPSRIAEVKVIVPPLILQKRITGILSAYDDLIENCQRRIRILETMARSLYREWFVHFRFPGHESHPRVDSPLGKIPKGWEVVPLEQLLTDHIGGGWGKESPDEEHSKPAWVIRGTDIPAARFCDVGGVPFRYHKPSNLKSRALSMSDILFEVSGGSKGQPVGRTLLVTSELFSAFNGDVICASFCKRVRPDTHRYASELLYLSFLDGYDSGEIEQFQVQSTGISNFKWTEYLSKVNRVVPPTQIQGRFRGNVALIFKQIAVLGLKVQNLRRTRDLLLPRLLSGQIQLEAAEAAL